MPEKTREFGGYEITLLLDGVFETTTDNLVHVDGADALRRTIEGWGSDLVRFDVNHYLLRGPNGISLVDAGTGPGWGPTLGFAREALAAAGVTPDAVDRVLLTHLHFDHARGLMDGAGAYFPRAEIIVPGDDLAFFTDMTARDALPEARRGAFALTEAIGRAYHGRIRTIGPGAVMQGVEAVPLPGHTPGQMGYLLRDGAAALLFWGDAVHIRVGQARDPKIGLSADLNPKQAAVTRRAILERAVTENLLVAGSHMTGFVRVMRDGDGFTMVNG